jgi:Cytochrome P460
MFGGFSEKSNPHDGFAVHVYFEKAGRDMMTTGKGVYPVNSLIIKEKLRSSKIVPPVPEKPSADSKPDSVKYSTELFTGMLKREVGYNPECGDWEFFIVDASAKNMLARGKIDSCIACHQGYKTTDYVTRAYMPAAK